jgi:hypothetical protein
LGNFRQNKVDRGLRVPLLEEVMSSLSQIGGGACVGVDAVASAGGAGGRTAADADGAPGPKRHRRVDVYGAGAGDLTGPVSGGATSAGACRFLFRTRDDNIAGASASTGLSMSSLAATPRAGYQPPPPVTTLGSIFAPSVETLRKPSRAFAALAAMDASKKPVTMAKGVASLSSLLPTQSDVPTGAKRLRYDALVPGIIGGTPASNVLRPYSLEFVMSAVNVMQQKELARHRYAKPK